MPEFTVRADSIDVEQIMEQIRARIREKRGVDYTEAQIRELAAVKLEKFLDPRGVRSSLLDEFRRAQPPAAAPPPNFAFEEHTLFDSHRAPLRWIRRLLRPLLKLFFNPNPLIQALHIQAQVNDLNADREARRTAADRSRDELTYEVLHNLVLETTRMGIEVKNLKMRVESLTGRLEFNERRARALESAVVYRPQPEEGARDLAEVAHPAPPAGPQPLVAPQGGQGGPAPGLVPGPGQRSRRRRRRRGRRGEGPAAAVMGSPAAPAPAYGGTGQDDGPGAGGAHEDESGRPQESSLPGAEGSDDGFGDQ